MTAALSPQTYSELQFQKLLYPALNEVHLSAIIPL